MTKERPEALAQFAESARRGERAGVQGLTATEATTPIPTDSKAKNDAASRVLAEGATGKDHGSEEAIDRLPDRIQETQGKDNSPTNMPDDAGQVSSATYDATRDPRTGRPPNPLEAQRIARENEVERLRSAQTSEVAEMDDAVDMNNLPLADDPSDDDPSEGHCDETEDDTIEGDSPTRMASPSTSSQRF